MDAPPPPSHHWHSVRRRLLLWGIVAGYTVALCDVVLVYNVLVARFSRTAATRVPQAMFFVFGAAYILLGFRLKRGLRSLAFFLPAALLTGLIVFIEPNPNKHIHVPEYVLMAWLVYAALAVDYRGRGLAALVLACAAMLGVVDELLQGLHPQRFYGLWDMGINALAGLIGVLTVLGLTTPPPGDWSWIRSLPRFRIEIAALIFGAVSALWICLYLTEVAAGGPFRIVYPPWMLALNILFLATAAAQLGISRGKGPMLHGTRGDPTPPVDGRTAVLWLRVLLILVMVIHAAAVWAAFAGREFR